MNLTSILPPSDNTTTTASTIKAKNHNKQTITHSNHQFPNTTISSIQENKPAISEIQPTLMPQPTHHSDPITIAYILNMTNQTKCNFQPTQKQ